MWAVHLSSYARGADWVDIALLPVAALAAREPLLTRLFPFQSMSMLCFSRSLELPYSNDIPCVEGRVDGGWTVRAQPYDAGPFRRLLDTDDPAEAVACVVFNLPSDLREGAPSLRQRPL